MGDDLTITGFHEDVAGGYQSAHFKACRRVRGRVFDDDGTKLRDGLTGYLTGHSTVSKGIRQC